MDILFYLRSGGKHNLLGDSVMGVFFFIIMLCDIPIDSGRSFLLKVKWTIYCCWCDYYGCVCADYYTVRTSDRKVCSFLHKVRWTTYFS